MCAMWAEGSNPSVLFSRLENLRLNDEFGKFTGFMGLDAQDIFSVLGSSLVFQTGITEAEKAYIVNGAILSVAKKGPLTSTRVAAEIRRRENSMLAVPLKNYVMLTNMSIFYFQELKKTSIAQSAISFTRRVPETFNRQQISERWKYGTFADMPETFTNVQVYVKARQERQAFTVALDALDLLRGIWNLYLNASIGMRFSSGITQAINRIRVGPLHTLHWTSGHLATDEFLYETDYSFPNTQRINGEWPALKTFERTLRKKLARHLFKSEMEDAIRRYVRAFDHQDLHVAFLELWSLLENLTSTLKADYRVTIKRTLFLHRDRDLHTQILLSLKNFRNRSVHSAARTTDIETLLFQLKRYVEVLFFFHLENRLRCKSIEDAGRFLDMSVDLNKLHAEIKERQKVIRFLNT